MALEGASLYIVRFSFFVRSVRFLSIMLLFASVYLLCLGFQPRLHRDEPVHISGVHNGTHNAVTNDRMTWLYKPDNVRGRTKIHARIIGINAGQFCRPAQNVQYIYKFYQSRTVIRPSTERTNKNHHDRNQSRTVLSS